MADESELAVLVERWAEGDREAFDEVVELVYDDLRAIAHNHLRTERGNHTLSTTALVHEAWVQLSERTGPRWRGSARFFALLSRIMRHVLIDYARRWQAGKRGGGLVRLSLDENLTGTAPELDLLALHQALTRLEEHDELLARVVECRFFGGMPAAQTAEALGISVRTVERSWQRARTYLFTLLTPDPPGEGGDDP